jgi:membrane protease YdiL (CAAX protease family)
MLKIEKKAKAVVFFGVFIFLEYFSDRYLQSIGPYTQYIAELIFVIISIFALGNFLKANQKISAKLTAVLLITFLFGIAIRLMVSPLNLPIPFDLTSTEIIIFLLIVGPVLEELLYRGTLINSISAIKNVPFLITIISAILFSVSHLRVINDVPEELRTFIKYQAVYTFILGAICAWVRQSAGFLWSISAHFLFNLGFYLASM